jgi:hypothetical protein
MGKLIATTQADASHVRLEPGSAYGRLATKARAPAARLGGWRGRSKEGEPKAPPLGLA